jgi:hypothetical protein
MATTTEFTDYLTMEGFFPTGDPLETGQFTQQQQIQNNPSNGGGTAVGEYLMATGMENYHYPPLTTATGGPAGGIDLTSSDKFDPAYISQNNNNVQYYYENNNSVVQQQQQQLSPNTADEFYVSLQIF